MARKAKAISQDISDNRTRLIDCLSFVSFASKDDETDKYTYVKIKDGFMTAADHTILMGGPVDVDLELCLHGLQFKAALEQCGQNFQLVQMDKQAVSIRSDKFRALIPAIGADLIAPYTADPPCGAMTDKIKTMFEILSPIVTCKDDRTINNCLQLNNNSGVATNGHVLLEYWHGINLPDNLKIPKRAIQAVAKVRKPLLYFGFTEHSVTFYFEDGYFIKTNLIATEYPDTKSLLDRNFNRQFYEKPSDFYKGLLAIHSFVVDDTIYFHRDFLATHASLEIGANYRIDGLPDYLSYSAKGLKFIEEYTHNINFPTDQSTPLAFYSTNVRGLLMGKHRA
jgi:hypothetical protein